MKNRVRDIIATIFKNESIEYVFGHTGGQISGLWKSIGDMGIKTILNCNEGNGVFMADGYARASGKIGVILATTGPGVTNFTTGLATAHLDSVPLIAVGASISTSESGKNISQDGTGRGRSIEQRTLFKSICKQAMLAPSPESTPDMVLDAFREALSGRPGPVYIEIPSDFWDKEIEYSYQETHQYRDTRIPDVNESRAKYIIEQLYEAERPLILIGDGAQENNIVEAMMQTLNAICIPFGVSAIGKNFVDEYHDYYVGAGLIPGKLYHYVKNCDFVLILGARVPPLFFNNSRKNFTLAQVDSDPSEIGRAFPIDYSAIGSIKSFLRYIPNKKHKNSSSLLQMVKKLHPKTTKEILDDGEGINPININSIVEELASEDTSIVCDTGYAKIMATQIFRTRKNQKFVVSDRNGCMGYSVPSSLGINLATKKNVVCFVGDGGVQMTLNELGTAMNYGLKTIYIIENNGGCATVRDGNIAKYGHSFVDTFKNPNYEMIAKAYGMVGFTVKTTDEFLSAFKAALKEDVTVIIDAHIDQSTVVWERKF